MSKIINNIFFKLIYSGDMQNDLLKFKYAICDDVSLIKFLIYKNKYI